MTSTIPEIPIVQRILENQPMSRVRIVQKIPTWPLRGWKGAPKRLLPGSMGKQILQMMMMMKQLLL
jgi:hypothetical protein